MNRIGQYDERIDIERPVTTLSDTGAPSTAGWEGVVAGGLWARVEPQGGSKVNERDGLIAIGSYVVTIRQRSDLDAKMRVRWRGLSLYIVAIDGLSPRDRETVLTCSTERP